MVVQRTLNKIEELKERPHHERRAIAYYGAIVIAGLILIIWGFFALNRFGDNAQSLTDAGVLDSGNPQAAAVASIVAEEETAPGTLTASSSNGRVDLMPSTR